MTLRRTALITGATAGLGLATADRLAEAGHNVALHGLEPGTAGDALARGIGERHKVEAMYVAGDFRDANEVARVIEAVHSQIGCVDILVSNAVLRHFSRAHELGQEEWEEGLAVNLSAPFHASRLVLPHMLAQNWGRIIAIGSIYSFIGAPDRAGYVTAKTGLVGLTRALALEVAGTGVSCNAVCPGTLPTPEIEARIAALAASRGMSIEQTTRDYLSARQPSGRFISMRAVTDLIAFLCGPDTADINGAALPVDAGWSVA